MRTAGEARRRSGGFRRSVRCVLCPRQGTGEGWSPRLLATSVNFRSAFTNEPMLSLAGRYLACWACARWLDNPNRAETPLPQAILAGIDDMLDAAQLHPTTRRAARAELVGQVRHLADHLTTQGDQQ